MQVEVVAPQVTFTATSSDRPHAVQRPAATSASRAAQIPAALDEAAIAALKQRAWGLTEHLMARGTRGGGLNLYTSPAAYEYVDQEDVDGEYAAFIGVFSSATFNGAKHRQACRATWFPGTPGELLALESEYNVKLRFVVGRSTGSEVRASPHHPMADHALAPSNSPQGSLAGPACHLCHRRRWSQTWRRRSSSSESTCT